MPVMEANLPERRRPPPTSRTGRCLYLPSGRREESSIGALNRPTAQPLGGLHRNPSSPITFWVITAPANSPFSP